MLPSLQLVTGTSASNDRSWLQEPAPRRPGTAAGRPARDRDARAHQGVRRQDGSRHASTAEGREHSSASSRGATAALRPRTASTPCSRQLRRPMLSALPGHRPSALLQAPPAPALTRLPHPCACELGSAAAGVNRQGRPWPPFARRWKC